MNTELQKQFHKNTTKSFDYVTEDKVCNERSVKVMMCWTSMVKIVVQCHFYYKSKMRGR